MEIIQSGAWWYVKRWHGSRKQVVSVSRYKHIYPL